MGVPRLLFFDVVWTVCSGLELEHQDVRDGTEWLSDDSGFQAGVPTEEGYLASAIKSTDFYFQLKSSLCHLSCALEQLSQSKCQYPPVLIGVNGTYLSRLFIKVK